MRSVLQTPRRDNAWNPAGLQTPRHEPRSYDSFGAYGQAYTPADTPAGTPGYQQAFTPNEGPAGYSQGITPSYNAATPSYSAATPGGPDLASTPGALTKGREVHIAVLKVCAIPSPLCISCCQRLCRC